MSISDVLPSSDGLSSHSSIDFDRIRKAPREQLELFRAALDQLADGVVLIDPDTLSYLDLNDRACQMMRVGREEALRLGPTHATGLDAAQLRLRCQAAIDSYPEVVREESVSSDARGQPIPTEHWRQAVRLEGRWVIVTTIRDIKVRKFFEYEQERFRAAQDLSIESILLVDRASLQYVDVNQTACRMFGHDRETMLRLKPYALSGVAHPNLEAIYDRVIASSPAVSVEESVSLRADGTTFPSEHTRQAIFSQGRWFVVVTIRDLTEKRKIEATLERKMSELVRSNQELERFAYIVSHDLQEPLRMISAYTQLLAKRYGDGFDQDGHEFMNFVVEGSMRMRRLIDDLLTYSRAGRNGSLFRWVSGDKALQEALANLQHQIDETGAVITFDAIPTVCSTRNFLVQLFQNLLGNAIKFRGPRLARVHVGVALQDNEWLFSVRDEGIGIAPQDHERVFVLFQRLHARHAYEGTGLGLAICKKITDWHRGRIWVKSDPAQEFGTTVFFTIPVDPPSGEVAGVE